MADPLSHGIKELLEQQRPELMKTVKTSARFWATLVKHNVLLNYQVDEIKVGSSDIEPLSIL